MKYAQISYPIVEQESRKGVKNTTYPGCPGEYDFCENPTENKILEVMGKELGCVDRRY